MTEHRLPAPISVPEGEDNELAIPSPAPVEEQVPLHPVTVMWPESASHLIVYELDQRRKNEHTIRCLEKNIDCISAELNSLRIKMEKDSPIKDPVLVKHDVILRHALLFWCVLSAIAAYIFAEPFIGQYKSVYDQTGVPDVTEAAQRSLWKHAWLVALFGLSSIVISSYQLQKVDHWILQYKKPWCWLGLPVALTFVGVVITCSIACLSTWTGANNGVAAVVGFAVVFKDVITRAIRIWYAITSKENKSNVSKTDEPSKSVIEGAENPAMTAKQILDDALTGG